MQLGGAGEVAGYEISAVFQPNAPSRGELRSLDGFRVRQGLKGRGQYLGERIRLAVSATRVTAWNLAPLGARLRQAGTWTPGDLLAIPVEPLGVRAPDHPAFVLLDLVRLEFIADLRAVHDGFREREIVARLGSTTSLPAVKRS